MPEIPSPEPLRRFRVRSDVSVWATGYTDAQALAASAAAWWSNETGFENLHGFGDPRGSVVVEEVTENEHVTEPL